MRWPILGVGLAAAASVLVGGHPAQHRDVVIRPPPPERTRLAAAYARVPLGFEQNRGQTDRRVRFLSHGPGTALFLTRGGATLALGRGRGLSIHLEGATGHQRLVGEGRLPGTVSYMLGNDRSRWRKGIATYSSVVYRDVYPGIAMRYHGNGQRLEYDFELQPGADPAAIRLGFGGARVRLDGRGDLVLPARGATVRQLRPRAYQLVDGRRHAIASRYALLPDNRVALRVGRHDPARALLVDPVLAYSTYFGGSADDYEGTLAVDSSGSAYLTGYTASTDFPTQSPIQATRKGSSFDIFVAKLDPSGTGLVYSTYIGGNTDNIGYAIAVDSAGDAYVVGRTTSSDFPTQNPYQTAQGGNDDVVLKLDPSGQNLLYSTYLGGNGNEWGYAIAIDAAGSAYVTGFTTATNFPTQNPIQPANAGGEDAYVTKLDPSGSGLVYSTYLGGSLQDDAYGITVDAAGNAYVTGITLSTDFNTQSPLQPANAGSADAFVAKVNAAGSALDYSTYLGGTSSDKGYGVAVGGSGSAYLLGVTSSTDFPTQSPLQPTRAPSQDQFVAKMNPSGSALDYSTYLGGNGFDQAGNVTVDPSGDAYLTGYSGSSDYPVQNPIQANYTGGYDAVVSELSPSGSALLFSTYLGGSGDDYGGTVALDPAGNAYVVGYTSSTDFPTASALQGTNAGLNDAFVTKIWLQAPGVTTGAAVAVGQSSATLGGTVSAAGPTTYYFDYGTSPAYGLQTPAAAGATSGSQDVAAPVSGLDASTRYHFRLVAVNGNGSSAGADQTFATASPPPAAAAAAAPAATTATPSVPPPTFTKTVDVTPVLGLVLVRRPGSNTFAELTSADDVPVGSTIDTRNGRMQLSIVDANGRSSSAGFYGGIATITQLAKDQGVAELRLTGERRGQCATGSQRASTARRKPTHHSLDHLWGSGSGPFRTRGHYAAATIRGTTWYTDDRCDGTLVRVTQGSVTVRDFLKRTTIVLRAGQRHLVRGR